jgi:tetratricopeptide (TPR) repeat protein
MQLLDQKSIQNIIPVWGEYLSWHNVGKLLLDLKMPEQAARIFEIALKICPNDLVLLLFLADCYKYSHQDRLAINTLKILVSLDFDNLEYHRLLAQQLENIGEWETSLTEREYVAASNRDSNNSIPLEDLYVYAKCALYANHFQLTIKICNELLTKNQDDSQAMIFSGEAYIRIGETSKGMEFLVQATQISPHIEDGWIALAEAQKNIYPMKTVIETLSTASKVIPNSSRIHSTLGEIYLLDHSPTMALPELFTAATLSPEDPQIQFNYGRALKLLGNIDESKAVLARAYQLNPNFPGLAQYYASLLMEQGALEEARIPLELLINSHTSKDLITCMDYARVVLAINKQDPTKNPPMKVLAALNDVLQNEPTNAEAKVLIAETLAATGDHEMAFQAYREALDTPLIADKVWLERISFGFGCVASALGKYDIAIAALQEAGQADPTNPDIYKALSTAFYSANLLEDSIRSARNVLVIDGDNPDNLAWFSKHALQLISNKKADLINSQGTLPKTIQADALNALTKAIQLAPTRTDLILQLGNLQSKIGAVAEAQDTFASIAQLDFASIDDLKNAAEYLSGIGNHNSAIACLENAVIKDQRKANPHDPFLYIKLAHEHVNNNDPTTAINTLDQAIGILPGETAIISQKIYLLLDLAQPIEALNCIEKTIHEKPNEDPDMDLIFLAARIYRSIGDFLNASKMTLKGIAIACNNNADTDLAILPKQYQTQASEIFRALIQPDRAYRIFKGIHDVSVNDFLCEQDYLDFLCLHTELALETGDQIRPEVQDFQLEISNPSFSRLMAIKARVMNKAGNFKQAEQVLQIGINNYL